MIHYKELKDIIFYFRIKKEDLMKKTATFTEKDTDLIQQIQRYQEEKGLSHFIDAIRQLCSDALQLKKISK